MMPKGYKLTEAQRLHPSKFQKGQKPWNTGTGGCKRGHDPSLYVPSPKTGIFVCLGCKRENGAKYREKVKNSAKHIIMRRVNRYQIDVDAYLDILNDQDGKCPICGKKITLKNSRIDHCHTTGKVRGILCVGCNTGLGLFKDSIKRFKNAIQYIERSNETTDRCESSASTSKTT